MTKESRSVWFWVIAVLVGIVLGLLFIVISVWFGWWFFLEWVW